VTVPKEVLSGKTTEITIKGVSPESLKTKGEAYLQVAFTLKESTSWASAGHEIAWGQIKLEPALPLPALTPSYSDCLKLTQDSTVLLISSPSSIWKFDLLKGALASWIKGTTELIHSPPTSTYTAPSLTTTVPPTAPTGSPPSSTKPRPTRAPSPGPSLPPTAP
jgi:beta-galactosidase/beta-glucuronidase